MSLADLHRCEQEGCNAITAPNEQFCRNHGGKVQGRRDAVTAYVEPQMFLALRAKQRQTGKSVGQIIREALEMYLGEEKA